MIAKNIIARNTLFNFIGKAVQMLVVIVSTPLLISYLGIKLYGVWVILSTITNYYGLFDIGISSTYIKYVAEYNARKDWAKLSETIATGFYFSILVGGVVLLIGYALKNLILSIFIKDYADLSRICLVYIGALFLFCVAYIGQFFQSLLDGYQRMDLKNISLIIYRIINLCLIFFFLVIGWKIEGIIVAGLLSWLVLVIVNLYQTKKIFPQMSFSIKKINKKNLFVIISYGWKIQITQLASWCINNIDKLFLGYFATPPIVAIYDVASKVRLFSREPTIAYISTISPAASERTAVNLDMDIIKGFYDKCTRYLMIMALPLCAFIFVNADNLIYVWLGKGFKSSATVLQILIIGNMFNLLTGCGTQITRGIGRPDIEAKYTIWVTICMILFGYFFTKYFGMIGLAISSSLALGLPSIAFVFIFNKYINISPDYFFNNCVKQPFLFTAFILSSDLLFTLLFPFSQFSRISIFIILTLKLVLYYGLYLYFVEHSSKNTEK